MTIRKFLFGAVACGAMVIISAANAQDQKQGRGRGGMPTVEQRIERLEQAVGSLSDAQKTKIKDIYAKSAEKMQGLSQDERREKMGELMRESGQQIRAVLTAEQQKKYDDMIAQGRGGGGGGGDNGGRRKKN